MDSLSNLEKPHIVCIPYPAQGHINPMLKLAKLLHYKGFHITFVNTEFNHKRLVKSQGLNSLTGVPSFRFEAIPDGLPESDPDATQDIRSLCESCNKSCLVPFKELVSKLNDTTSSNVPPVTCIVSDGVLHFTLVAAEELGIPDVVLRTTSVCGFMGYVQYRNLIEKGYTPLKDWQWCFLVCGLAYIEPAFTVIFLKGCFQHIDRKRGWCREDDGQRLGAFE